MNPLKNRRKRTVLCLLLCFVLAFTSIHAQELQRTVEEIQKYIDTVLTLTEKLSITEKTKEQMMYDALVKLASEDEESLNKVLAAIAGTVDGNSTFIPKDEYHEMMNQLEGKTGGIGITATVKDGFLDIVTVLENSPAAQAGFVPGDKIVAVDGRDVTGTAALTATDFLKGEIGSQVTVTILSANGLKRDATLKRYAIPEQSIEKSIINGKIGYIKIKTFASNTPEQVEEALQELQQKQISKLILDLRNNGGGVFASGVKVADLFLEEDKTIVTVRGRTEEEQRTYTASAKKYDFDLCLLVNEYTASSSEIVTGALKDNHAGRIIGENTYGKGTVQGIFPLADIGGALKITIQTYLTPSGEFIHRKGIQPDQTVENIRKRYTLEELPELTFQRVLQTGDAGEDVKSVKFLLNLLNFSAGQDNEKYDETTAGAVKQFQASVGLFPYGVCDITTQSYLREKVLNTTFLYDTQLPAAVEYLQAR